MTIKFAFTTACYFFYPRGILITIFIISRLCSMFNFNFCFHLMHHPFSYQHQQLCNLWLLLCFFYLSLVLNNWSWTVEVYIFIFTSNRFNQFEYVRIYAFLYKFVRGKKSNLKRQIYVITTKKNIMLLTNLNLP